MNRLTDRIVVLSSGGLDSAICLTIVLDQSFDCFALSFYYGQRSVSELAAERLVDPQGGLDELDGSALTDKIWRFLNAGRKVFLLPMFQREIPCLCHTLWPELKSSPQVQSTLASILWIIQDILAIARAASMRSRV